MGKTKKSVDECKLTTRVVGPWITNGLIKSIWKRNTLHTLGNSQEIDNSISIKKNL